MALLRSAHVSSKLLRIETQPARKVKPLQQTEHKAENERTAVHRLFVGNGKWFPPTDEEATGMETIMKVK